MRKFTRKITATTLAFAMSCMAMLSTGPVKVLAENTEKQTGIIYCNFTEYTDADDIKVGTHLLLLSRDYKTNEAVVGIPDGSAEIFCAGKFDDSLKDGSSYNGDEIVTRLSGSERYIKRYYAGRMGEYYQAAVDVVKSGTGFDSCSGGTIAYMSDNDIDLDQIGKIRRGTFEEYCNTRFLDTVSSYDLEYYASMLEYYGLDENATVKEYKIADINYMFEIYKDYYPDYFGSMTYEEFIEYYYGEGKTEQSILEKEWLGKTMDIVDGRMSWRYGCDGGGVSYVGPMNLYSYDEREFTEDDLALDSHFEYKGGEKVITTDDVTVLITVDNKVYEVSDFIIDEEDNSINLAERDNIVKVKVGTVSVAVEVPITPDVDLKDEVAVPELNEVVNITPAIDGNSLNASIGGSDIEKVFNITEDDKANGAWVWMELKEIDKIDVAVDDVAAIEKALGDNELGLYIDISLYKQTIGYEKVKVSTTGEDAIISFVVPEELRKEGRVYKIMYTHDGGDAVIIEPISYDEDTAVLTFKASEFSTYALIYSDAVEEKPIIEDDKEEETIKKEPTVENITTEAVKETTADTAPKTGDEADTMLYLVFMGIAATAILVAGRKCEEEK